MLMPALHAAGRSPRASDQSKDVAAGGITHNFGREAEMNNREMHNSEVNNFKYRWLVTASLAPILVLAAAFAQTTTPPEIPAGTTIRVRMIDKLNSEQNQTGDTFHATLEEPITVNGRELYPKGADILGRVTDVHKTGQLTEPGELDLTLLTVSTGRLATSIRVQPLVIKGESHAKSNATKIGGGAALGAIIGAVAGGGKGAAIGTVAGGAAGTGVAAATGKKPAIVDSEAVLTFVTTTAAAATSTAAAAENPPAPSSPAVPADSTPAASASDKAPASTAAAPTPPASEESGNAVFTLRDRRIIRNCVMAHADAFPPGATQAPELPAGAERQLRRGETLSPDQQQQLQSLPLACEEQLPGLPSDLERVVYNGKVLLIDGKGLVHDSFDLGGEQ
jgi:hypothetical protein